MSEKTSCSLLRHSSGSSSGQGSLNECDYEKMGGDVLRQRALVAYGETCARTLCVGGVAVVVVGGLPICTLL